MNFEQLLQVIGISALGTLILVFALLRLKAWAQGWLKHRLPPRHMKAAGVRRRGEKHE
ncbi:MAG: cellulose biosynthesis protein BcsF [Pseudomonas putida]|jgi:cellulose biosynthesis operon protein BcsF/YhjT|nr:cellulose biosynthesis protein BcsF [Pseudomonas putida]